MSKMENLYLLLTVFGTLYVQQLTAMYAYAFIKSHQYYAHKFTVCGHTCN